MRKTLVILTPGFPENEADTTCIPERQIFVRVLKETYPELNIVVVSFQYPNQPREYRWNGIKIIALGGKNKSGLHRRMTWIGAWQKLKKLNKDHEVIGLLSFWLDECAFIANKFSKKYAVKHYSWLLGQDARPDNKYVNQIMPDGESLIALSDYLVDEFEKNYGITPKHVIPGAVDITLFKPQSTQRDIDVLGVGSLIPLKQYGLFIETIKFLKESHPDVKAVICGKGIEMQKLKDMAALYQLENNITFKGELSHPEILEHMQRSKILLHPSRYEGFSTVLLEALYAGAHVVSFFRPMKDVFLHHHVVNNIDEMNAKTLTLLNDTGRGHDPVLVNSMTQMADSVVKLFGNELYREVAIS
ncbi:glycosyltransferase [Mucilaginibacter corticis]|nr:glycosyltransferase [Mucilaginibacter corticis]